VFDRTYSHAEETGDAVESGFNIAGWISSYDKRPIPANEMREWVDRTCDRILALKPRRVLELGCGTGLLLFRVAPHTEHYHGIDIAATALEGIRRDPAFAPIASRVTLAQGRADETTDLDAGSFDTIVINSVVQYFPTAEYLVTVLTRAMRLLAPGGKIFVGDVRLLPLLSTLHTSVALHEASDELSVADLRALAEQRLWHDSELVVDPAFFEMLRLESPRLAAAEVLLKRGAAVNELTKFRGDVVLHADTAPPAVPSDATPSMRAETLDDIRALLARTPSVLRLTDLRDARLAADLDAQERIASAPSQGTVHDIRAERAARTGVSPEAVCTIDDAYDVSVEWPASGRLGYFDAVFRRRDVVHGAAQRAPVQAVARPWADFVHHPAAESFSPEQVSRWREHLAATLPDYMIPSAFVRMTALPLSPSGKVDRKALKPPAVRRRSRTYIAPRTATEATVTALWAEILRVEQVSVDDGFLDLGGHSLLAMRVVGRVRKEMGISVGLDALVRGETAAQFAGLLDSLRQSVPTEDDEDDLALAPVSRSAYQRSAGAGS
jgi:ubiquinone/menaquinone biosynthesis C-methylase UbiE